MQDATNPNPMPFLVRFEIEAGAFLYVDPRAVRAIGSAMSGGAPALGVAALIMEGVPPMVVRASPSEAAALIDAGRAHALRAENDITQAAAMRALAQAGAVQPAPAPTIASAH